MDECFSFPCSWHHLSSLVFKLNHPDWSKLKSQCTFSLHFSIARDVKYFKMFLHHSYSLFESSMYNSIPTVVEQSFWTLWRCIIVYRGTYLLGASATRHLNGVYEQWVALLDGGRLGQNAYHTVDPEISQSLGGETSSRLVPIGMRFCSHQLKGIEANTSV